MNIILVTPAKKQSRAGNRTTAVRWAKILRSLGHRVEIQFSWDEKPAEMMVALHAWRSADSVSRFRARFPARPLVVALTGTDIYRFQQSHREETLRSMWIADALTCLHDLVHEAIPPEFAEKLHVVHQSASPLTRPRAPSKRTFDVCVVAHLREEKDSLCTAFAARGVPEESRLRVIHLGMAHNQEWADAARHEMTVNPRYHWLGEVPAWRVRRVYGKAHLMVLSSIMEGGANVISESVIAGLPVIASEIHGSVGLLGADYPGYYPPKDTDALRTLLWRAETDPGFVANLAARGADRAGNFTPEKERDGWRHVLEALGVSS